MVFPRGAGGLERTQGDVTFVILAGQPNLGRFEAVVRQFFLEDRIDAFDLRAAAGDDDILQQGDDAVG